MLSLRADLSSRAGLISALASRGSSLRGTLVSSHRRFRGFSFKSRGLAGVYNLNGSSESGSNLKFMSKDYSDRNGGAIFIGDGRPLGPASLRPAESRHFIPAYRCYKMAKRVHPHYEGLEFDRRGSEGSRGGRDVAAFRSALRSSLGRLSEVTRDLTVPGPGVPTEGPPTEEETGPGMKGTEEAFRAGSLSGRIQSRSFSSSSLSYFIAEIDFRPGPRSEVMTVYGITLATLSAEGPSS